MPEISRFLGIVIAMFYSDNWERARTRKPLQKIEPLE